MSFLHHILAKQARVPKGLLGKLAGRGMARINRPLIEWTLQLLEIKPSDYVLEIGFGPGVGIQIAAQMASQGRVTGIDLSDTMLSVASNLNAEAIAAGRVELRYGNASSLPYEHDTFDRAFAVNVLYFWDDPVAVLREMRRVTKPGGRIALAFYDKEDLKEQKLTQSGVFALFTGDEAVQLLTEAGFSQARYEKRAVHRAEMGMCAIGEK